MAFPQAASPWPPGSSHHSPALQGVFIPELWSAQLVMNLYDQTVLNAIANSKWQAQARRGTDTIQIPKRPTISIRPYEIGLPLEVERPSAGKVTLALDKGLYFATILDDVLAVQSNYPLLQIWTEEAAWSLKVALDTAVLATLPASLLAANSGATAGRQCQLYNLGAPANPRVVAPEGIALAAGEIDVMSLITNMTCVLNEQNVPPQDRWLLIPSWVGGFLRRSKAFRSAQEIGDQTSVFRTGRIGTVEGMPVYESNLLPKAVESGALCWYMFMGHMDTLTFAWQLNSVDKYPAPLTMGEMLRGLYTYGSLVVDPKRYCAAYVKAKTGIT